jgi:hypothetical protein
MRIRFRTKDNLVQIRECNNIDEIPAQIVRPISSEDGKPLGVRRYEYRGEIKNGIPTLNEC